MGVKEGYKQTEVGIIPEEWIICEIGALNPFITSGSRGWAEYYADQGDAFIRITNLFRSSIYLDMSDLKLVNLPPESREGTRTALQDGDLLISITADIGIIGFVNKLVPKPAYINQHIALARFDSSKANSHFVSYFLASPASQKRFQALTDQGAKAGMNLSTVKQIQTVLPPLPEQKAIAAALSDTDELIAGLEALVAKKRAIKQGAMQQLLTGRKRLPEFKGGHSGSIGDLIEASPQRKRHTLQDAYTFIGMEDVSENGNLLNQNMISLNEVRSGLTYFEREDVLVAKITPCFENGKGANLKYLDQLSGFGSTEFHVLRANSESDQSYLFFQTQMSEFRQQLADEMVGSAGHKRVPFKALLNYPLPIVPPLPEQQAIATILSDMDTEIDSLGEQLGKTRALKQGMMQELLTGRIRLV